MRALHHVALRCEDIEQTARFYSATLGLHECARKHRAEDGALRAIWLRSGDVIFMCERREPGEPAIDPRSMELLCFEIPREELSSWRARLAVIEAETQFTLYSRDPDGRRVAVSCYAFDL